jgi:hypothetical protein
VPTTFTPNLNLAKPDGSSTGDLVDVAVVNDNMDKLDAAHPLIKKTAADQDFATAVLTDVAAFQYNLPLLGTWEFTLILRGIAIGGATTNKGAFVFPANSFVAVFNHLVNTSETPASGVAFAGNWGLATANESTGQIKFFITNTALGLVKFQMALAAVANTSRLKTGSIMRVQKVA